MLLQILLVIQIIICVALVGVILLQRSEGGALGMGGGTGGFMTARGAGNLLTRTTAILATLFFIVSFGLTIFGNTQRSNSSVTDRVDINAATPPAGAAAASAPTEPVTDPAAAAEEGPSLDDLAAPLPSDQPAPAEPATKK